MIYPVRQEVAVGREGIALLVAGVASLLAVPAACTNPLQPTPTPITSAGDPAAPVPFRWTLSPDGLLRLQGGTLHAIASEVRLLDDTGKTVASTPTTMLGAGDADLCGAAQALGMVAAELRPPDVGKWPGQYRLEARVGNTWRPAQLTKAC